MGDGTVLLWDLVADAGAGDFHNLETSPGGQWAVWRSETMETTRFSSPRVPVQYDARRNLQPQFVLPEGFRPAKHVTYTVTGTQVHADGTPMPNSQPATSDLTIAPNGEMRYVDNPKVDGLGYVNYRVTRLTWPTNEVPETPYLWNRGSRDAGVRLWSRPAGEPGLWLASATQGDARISTHEQTLDLQRDALRAAGCDPDHIYVDQVSGSSPGLERPGLGEVQAYARTGDQLVIWRLDRLGRSVKDLIEQVANLEAQGIELVSLQESIDTTTPDGRALFHMCGVFAEFERPLLSERTKAGLAAGVAASRRSRSPSSTAPAN